MAAVRRFKARRASLPFLSHSSLAHHPFPRPPFILLITLRLHLTISTIFPPFASLSVFFVFHSFLRFSLLPLQRPFQDPHPYMCPPHFSSSCRSPHPPFPIDVPFHRLPFCYSLQSSLVSHWVAVVVFLLHSSDTVRFQSHGGEEEAEGVSQW